jgi:hypothetical protein
MTGPHCVVLCVLVAASPLSPGSEQSRVSVEHEGRRIEMSHVKAARYTPASGDVEIRLLFASQDAREVVVADAFGRDTIRRWVLQTGASALAITFPESSPEQYTVQVYNVGDQSLSGGGTSSGGETRGVFSAISTSGDRVTGELKFTMAGMAMAGAFEAALGGAAEAQAVTGKTVVTSPQGQTLLAFARAMSRMDLKAAQPHFDGDIQKDVEEMRKVFGPDGLKELLDEQFGDPNQLEQRLASPEAALREDGDKATITVTRRSKTELGESSETTTFQFIRVGGAWKIRM